MYKYLIWSILPSELTLGMACIIAEHWLQHPSSDIGRILAAFTGALHNGLEDKFLLFRKQPDTIFLLSSQ